MKCAVVVFPGSNCDVDMYYAIRDGLGQEVDFVWHEEHDLSSYQCILLPGGFSYGDYLRCGAIAQFAPILEEVKKAAAAGKFVLGVCNGFQILLEAGLLPGAMLRNESLKFCCYHTAIRVVNNESPFTQQYREGQVLSIPIAHGEGNYYCDPETLRELQTNRQIVFTYEDNPNGSTANIAGIVNREGNVCGMMPHPERAVEKLLGSEDGLGLFISLFRTWKERCVNGQIQRTLSDGDPAGATVSRNGSNG